MKLVQESLIIEKDKLELSAGLVIIQDNKILLVHPTNSSWYGTFSIPKGHVEKNEDILDAAIRETKEETGIEINKKDIYSKEDNFIDYTDKKGNLYKRVYYYLTYPSYEISKEHMNLQQEEVDWCGFLTKEKAKKRIFWRFKELLNYLDY
ncbi:MAG: NUDIX hydrolase [bacterium]